MSGIPAATAEKMRAESMSERAILPNDRERNEWTGVGKEILQRDRRHGTYFIGPSKACSAESPSW